MKLMLKAMRKSMLGGMRGAFVEAKHKRATDGKFASKPGGDVASKPKTTRAAKASKGDDFIKTNNVGKTDRIVAQSARVKKYASHSTVDSFISSHPKGKAFALRTLAADHKAGRIKFAADKPAAAPTGKISANDKITKAGKTKTVKEHIETHPKGKAHAAKEIIADKKAERVTITKAKTADKPATPKTADKSADKPSTAVKSGRPERVKVPPSDKPAWEHWRNGTLTPAKLTEEQRHAFGRYAGTAYKDTAPYMRGEVPNPTDETRRIVRDMDDVLRNNPDAHLAVDTALFHGGSLKPNQIKIGATFKNPAFQSFSIDPQFAEQFAMGAPKGRRGVLLKLNGKAGDRGYMSMRNVVHKGQHYEQEVVRGGGTFKIVGVEQTPGTSRKTYVIEEVFE